MGVPQTFANHDATRQETERRARSRLHPGGSVPAAFCLPSGAIEAVGLTQELARNRGLLASRETAGPTQEMAINGVALQVRTLTSPTARLEYPSPTETAAVSCPQSVDVRQTSVHVETPPDGVSEERQKLAALAVSEPASSSSRPFRPLLEVDRFLWPDDCDRVARTASDQLDGLAEQIADEARLGRKIVGVASCRRGDGCTTLVLSVAPRLAALGFRVLLVDSDFHNPLLARRLGLLPETGWEEVLAGHLPLEEVLVESLQDRLALLPLRAPSAGRSYDFGANCQPRASLEAAAGHYELLLVDVGRFFRHDAHGSNLPQPTGKWLESLVLIHNVRSTPEEDLQRNRQRIRDAGIHEMGIVENFA